MDFEKYSKNNLNLYTNDIPDILSDVLRENKENICVLDLGCGDGSLLLTLYNNGYFEKTKKVVGVDLSAERLERLKLKKIPGLELLLSDASSVKELNNNDFDLIFNTQVIEHVEDDKKLLSEIYRMLKKGGILYISSVVKSKYGWYVHRCNGKWVLDPTHVREYSSEKEFNSLVESQGFKIVKTKMTLYYFTPIEFLIRRIYYRITRSKNMNSFFLRHKALNILRRIKIPVFGYHIIELIAKK